MITSFALFEGTVGQERTEAFRAAILEEVLPHWKSFPGVLSVRVSFENERDEGAPELPLILAITYPNRAAVDVALASPERGWRRQQPSQCLPGSFRAKSITTSRLLMTTTS